MPPCSLHVVNGEPAQKRQMRLCVAALPQAMTSESATGGSIKSCKRQLVHSGYNFSQWNYAWKAHLREMLLVVALSRAELRDSEKSRPLTYLPFWT